MAIFRVSPPLFEKYYPYLLDNFAIHGILMEIFVDLCTNEYLFYIDLPEFKNDEEIFHEIQDGYKCRDIRSNATISIPYKKKIG